MMEYDTLLTKQEREKVQQAFEAFDKDGNGYIDEQELKSVLESILWSGPNKK